MKIYVNGGFLDMAEGEISTHFANMRFSDIFSDDFTTDIDIPLSNSNANLLDVWGLQDRSGILFGRRIPCVAVMRTGSRKGTLQVVKVTRQSITITIFLSSLPETLNAAIRDILTDSNATIMRWTTMKYEGVIPTNDINLTYYGTGATGVNLQHPNIKLSYLLSLIETATGVTMPLVGTDYRIIPPRQVVCPQNGVQCIHAQYSGAIDMYGQHICSAVNTADLYVEFNRDCNVAAKVYLKTSGAVTGASVLVQLYSGGSWTTVVTESVPAVGDSSYFNVSFAAHAGERFRLAPVGWTGESFWILRYTNYTITADDYDMPLNYDPSANYDLPAYVTDNVDYIYFGMLCNLPDVSVRSLLSSLAWLLGKRVHADMRGVTFIDADRAASIDARIVGFAPSSQYLGQRTTIQDGNGNVYFFIGFDSDQLEGEKVLHESLFPKLRPDNTYNVIQLPLINSDGSTNEVEGLPLAVCADMIGVYSLFLIDNPSSLGIEQLSRIMEADVETYEDVSLLDYVYILGHTYMVAEGDTDEKTGKTTFKALLI